jgi:tetratricopeptide (TPR) repeat protein
MPSENSNPAQSEIETEQRSLDLFLSNQYGFRLGLALYNDVVARRAHIEQTRTALAAKTIELVVVDLQTFDKEEQLLACVQKQIESLYLSAEQRLAVIVLGLEGRVNYSPELSDYDTREGRFLANANFQRELWPQGCPYPTVLWMTESLERAFVAQAPDLWHWRSQVFDLRAFVAPALDLILQPYGSQAFHLAHPASRIPHLEESLAAYQKSNNTMEVLETLNDLGKARMENGEIQASMMNFETLLTLSRQNNNAKMESKALGNLGAMFLAIGDLNKAKSSIENALSLSRKNHYLSSEGMQLSSLGNIYFMQGDFQKAIELHEDALRIAIETNDRLAESSRLGNLANAYQMMKDYRNAQDLYRQSLDIARSNLDRRGEATNLGNLGLTCANLGEVDRSIEYYQQAIAINQDVGDQGSQGHHLIQLASIFWQREDLQARPQTLRMGEDAYELLNHVQSSLAPSAAELIRTWRHELAALKNLESN